MIKRLLATLTLTFLCFGQVLAFSLPGEIDQEIELTEEAPSIQAVVSADFNVEVNKKIIFDASATDLSPYIDLNSVTYEWFYGDGNREQGVEVVHTYAESGEYEVTLVVRDAGENQSTIIHDLLVYERSIALVTNVADKEEQIQSFVDSAREQDVLINLIETYDAQSEFLAEEALQKKVFENLDALDQANLILVWTEGSSGLTLFSQLKGSLSDEVFFEGKSIVFISDADFGSLENIARGVYQSINPDEIILARSESVWVILETQTIEEFLTLLESRDVQYVKVDTKLQLRPWNVLSYLVNVMLDKGVPSNTIRLVLMLPVIVTVVAFMKQVFGLATLGVYTPSILALSFIALELSYGLIILLSILAIGTITRLFLRKYRLLYIPRMAIVLTFVSLTILVLLFIGAVLDISSVVGVAVFPMLIMSTMVEKFVSIQSGKGLRRALTLVGESILVAILCYFVAEWSWLKVVMLGHPEAILLFLIANVAMARWSGLRLLEYVRFREIIRHAEE
ncbi:MAG: PKD repeat protein [Oceanicoccus sp.]|jgi:PKD repeat protein